MKKLYFVLFVLSILLIAGCSQKPDDVASATIDETEEAELPVDTEESTDDETAVVVVEEDEDADVEVGNLEDDMIAIELVPITSMEFEWEGFAPGKSHVGTFNEIEGELHVQDGEIIGMQGVVQADSVESDSSGLDNHLMNDDFFDVENCPTIEFTSMEIADGTMTGDLTFHCITKEVSFPVEVSENGISADFMLNTEPFEMKYIGVDEEVRITFDFQI